MTEPLNTRQELLRRISAANCHFEFYKLESADQGRLLLNGSKTTTAMNRLMKPEAVNLLF